MTDRATCVLQGNPGPMTLNGTNTWLLGAPGSPEVVVVDPGADDAAHRTALDAALDGREVALVVATHHHSDHVGGLDAFLAEHPAPVVTSPGEHSVAGLDLVVHATPGHTADSVSLQLASGELLTGDTLLGRGSTVIALDGDLGDHLASLQLLLTLGPTVVLPGHGRARHDARAAIAAQITHRMQRLEQVQAAVDAGARNVDDVVRAVHGALDPTLTLARAAAASVRAHLRHLGHDLP